jgi:sugar phosphate isomerase/epimerase
MRKDNLYLSTIDENAHLLAKQHDLGLEFAEFCTPWYLDTDFLKADSIIREKHGFTDRFVMHGPFSELFPCAIDPKVREIAAERYRQTIRIAQGYGIHKVILHGGYNPRIYYPVWYTEQSVLFWKDFVREIPEDMVLCLENVFEEEPDMIAQIVREVNDKRIRICLDVGHINAYSKVPVMQWLESCAEITEHFHIHNNDTTRDSHSPLWEGTISMKELLAQLEKKCPSATITMELMDTQASVRWLLEE